MRGDAALAQVHPQPPDDVFDVALALAQVRILDGVEQLLDLVERAMYRPLRVDVFLPDEERRAAEQHRVVEDQELRFEQRREIRRRAVG